VGAPILAAASAPAGYLGGLRAWAASLAAAEALEAVPAVVAASLTRGSVRASMAASAYTNLATAAYLGALAALPRASRPPLVWAGIGYLLVYPVQMIYSVTLNSLPSTYGRRPVYPLLPLPYALATLAAALVLARPGEAALAAVLGSASTLAYLPAVRIHEIPRLWREEVRGSRRPPIVVATHKYFLEGHVFVAVMAAYAVAAAILYEAGWLPTPVCIAHALAVGFSGLHILIHAPLMLPVILGIHTARRYNPLGYALLVIAPPAACLSPDLLAPLVLAAVAVGVYIVWPPPKRARR
jgi:hypothetical protein